MAIDEEQAASEDFLIAVLDTGWNNACHGSRWMDQYFRLAGADAPLGPSSGKFRGAGGRVEVPGRRSIPVSFMLESGGCAEGCVSSVEFSGSDAPLPLRIHAQKYSRVLYRILALPNKMDYQEFVFYQGIPCPMV